MDNAIAVAGGGAVVPSQDQNLPALPRDPVELAITQNPDLARFTSATPYVKLSMAIVVGFLALFLGWGLFAELESGAVAPGVVSSEGNRRVVQHLEGGVIAEIRVKEGDQVKAGDVLVVLDDTITDATMESRRTQYWNALIHEARLIAQRDGLPGISFPAEIERNRQNALVAQSIQIQENAFSAMRSTQAESVKAIDGQIASLRQEMESLNAQRRTSQQQMAFANEELQAARSLADQGFATRPRVLNLERLKAEYENELHATEAGIARAEQRISELELRKLDLDRSIRNQAGEELRQVQERVAVLQEELRAIGNVLGRRTVVAPEDGTVLSMRYHTLGGVVPPGGEILSLVPKGVDLIIDTQVRPEDIDVVHPGMPALVTLNAFNTRTTPDVMGEVIYVSADRIEDPRTGHSFFRAQVKLNAEELAAIDRVFLSPGMPATVKMIIGRRTPLEYLFKPLTDVTKKAFTEE